MDEKDKALQFPASGGWNFHVEKLPNYADAMANRDKELERLKTAHEAAEAQRKTPSPRIAEARAAYLQEASREQRKEFYGKVSNLIEKTPAPDLNVPHAFTRREQARVLRHMADQIDKSENPVARAVDRVKERDSWPNREFFQKTPAKPTPEMVGRWKDRAEQERHETPARKDWGAASPQQSKPLEIKPLPVRDPNKDRDRDR